MFEFTERVSNINSCGARLIVNLGVASVRDA